VIKDDFRQSNSWSRSQTLLQATCMWLSLVAATWWLVCHLHGWMIVPCTAAVSLKINFARLQGGFGWTPPGYWRAVCEVPFPLGCTNHNILYHTYYVYLFLLVIITNIQYLSLGIFFLGGGGNPRANLPPYETLIVYQVHIFDVRMLQL